MPDSDIPATPPSMLPTADQVRLYLRYKGWSTLSRGAAGTLWANEMVRIGVPDEDDSFLIEGVISRVASFERRPQKAVRDSIRYLLFDVTHLRAANDRFIADTIPLDAAEKIITSSRRMFQATATTARMERAHIGQNFSRIGNGVVKQALMGHTERGSFIIPVLIPLPEPEPADFHQLDLLEQLSESQFHRAAPEPFARRVVRTFAQSMQAVQEIVVEPARVPSVDQIYELVYRGVSREFCLSLQGILNEPSVGEFGATIDWAPAVTPPTSLSKMSITADAADLVKTVADRLRQTKVDPNQVFTGTIVQLRHESLTDPYGEIAVTTVRNGRSSEITVRLPLDEYESAWQWHYEGRAVLVEGIVRRAPGRRLRVDRATRFHPVDQIFLPEDAPLPDS